MSEPTITDVLSALAGSEAGRRVLAVLDAATAYATTASTEDLGVLAEALDAVYVGEDWANRVWERRLGVADEAAPGGEGGETP